MKKLAVFLVLGVVACGPRIDDKDKSSWNPDNASENNTSANNTTGNGGTNSTNPNNVTDPDPANNVTDPDPANNVTDPDPANNVTDPDPDPTNNDPDPTNNTTMTEVERKCAQACELLWGNCVDTRCSLSGDVAQVVAEVEAGCKGTGGDPGELCTARYAAEPGYRSLVDDILADGTCNGEVLRDTRCFTFGTDVCQSCPTPNLDTPCATDSQCDGGLLAGLCNYEDLDGANPGGQCLAGGCAFGDATAGTFVVGGSTGCGEDGACYVIDASNSACFPRCNTNNDCRSGYACLAVGSLVDSNGTSEFLGICQTACSDAVPCAEGLVCGSTRSCETICTSNADCPSDFTCSGTASDGTKYCRYTG